jgi:hypothetical protein
MAKLPTLLDVLPSFLPSHTRGPTRVAGTTIFGSNGVPGPTYRHKNLSVRGGCGCGSRVFRMLCRLSAAYKRSCVRTRSSKMIV